MRSFVLTVALGLCATFVKAQSNAAVAEAYYAKEVPIATQGLYANIGPSGFRVPGAGVRKSSALFTKS